MPDMNRLTQKCGTCQGKGEVCCCGWPLDMGHDHNTCGPPIPCDACNQTGVDWQAEANRLAAELQRLEDQIAQAHREKHGSSGMCCSLREQELRRADRLADELVALQANFVSLAQECGKANLEAARLAAENQRLTAILKEYREQRTWRQFEREKEQQREIIRKLLPLIREWSMIGDCPDCHQWCADRIDFDKSSVEWHKENVGHKPNCPRAAIIAAAEAANRR